MTWSARLKSTWQLIRQSVVAWSEDYAPSMGAALAFYTLFSITPLVVIAIALAGFVFGAEAARGEVLDQARTLIGEEGARALRGLLRHASQPNEGTIATIVGVLTLLVGATTVFSELQTDLDRIWRVPQSKSSGGVLALIRARLLAFGLILIIGVLLMVLLVAGTVLSALERWSESWIGLWGPLLRFADLALSISIVTVLFAVIYKVLPRARVDWRDVWVGSLVTSLLFALGKFALGEYLAHSSLASSFGAAGSLIVLTVWVYYSAQIFLLGAEFTWLYAHRHGSRSHTGGVEPNAALEIPHRSATDTKASSPVPAWENA